MVSRSKETPYRKDVLKGITIQKFDTGMGRIEAHLIKESDTKLKDHRTEYVEVYRSGESTPEKMIAWFGSVQSFAKWISGADHSDF